MLLDLRTSMFYIPVCKRIPVPLGAGGATVGLSTGSTCHPFDSGTVISLSTFLFSLNNLQWTQRTK